MSARDNAFRRNAHTNPTYDLITGGGGGDENAERTRRGGTRGRSSNNDDGSTGRDTSSPPPARVLRQTFRQSSRPPGSGVAATADNEELRAALKSARYEVSSLKQEREVLRLRHEQELREAAARAEADFQRAQGAANTQRAATGRQEALAKELADVQERATAQQRELEKRLRTAQEQGKEARDEVADAQAELASTERQWSHRFQELERRHDALQKTMREVRGELDAKSSNLEAAQTRLRGRETEVGELEAEVLQLRANGGGGGEELSTVRTQLTEQVEHIRKLEMAGREATAELRQLRQMQKRAAILEEEKRSLQLRLGRLDEAERELDEAKYQRQLLQDERNAWTAYLKTDDGDGGDEGEDGETFDSPEAVARALRNERIEKASLLDRLGAAQPEILEKEATIRSLEEDKARLQVELAQLKTTNPDGSATSTSGNSSGHSRAQRLERQRTIANREIQYLREQLKTFDAEDITGEMIPDADPETQQQQQQRIAQLEELVTQYRSELDAVNTQLNSLESTGPGTGSITTTTTAKSLKRPAPDDASDGAVDPEAATAQVGELSRKLRKLQQELATAQTAHSTLAADNSALQTQLASVQATARTRVLALRNNPTDDFEARKLSTIALLRRENAALLEQLEQSRAAAAAATSASSSSSSSSSSGPATGGSKSSSNSKSRIQRGDYVPVESLEDAQLRLEEAQAKVRSREKGHARLKQVFAAKSQEMREAVASLLGWNVEFQPNGRFRLTSIWDEEAEAAAAAKMGKGDGRARTPRHITFHGEKGTMTIAGGPEGPFGREIRGLVRFWVEERNEIPGFLAAYTLENLERLDRSGALGSDDDDEEEEEVE